MDETTRQVNRRTIEALHTAMAALGSAEVAISRAYDPLEELSRSTNAHDALLEQIDQAKTHTRQVRAEVQRRLAAESGD